MHKNLIAPHAFICYSSDPPEQKLKLKTKSRKTFLAGALKLTQKFAFKQLCFCGTLKIFKTFEN